MIRRLRWWLIAAGVVVALGIAVLPQSSSPRTTDQRVDHLAQQIRCPTCAGQSVLQSDAPLAQSSKEEIRNRVVAGQSDEQIKGFFVSRYGSSALLSPAQSGITLLVWWLPVVVAAALLALAVYVAMQWSKRAYVERATEVVPARGSVAMLGKPSFNFRERQRSIWVVGSALLIALAFALVARTMTERQPGETLTGSVTSNTTNLMAKAEQQTAEGNAAGAVKTYDEILQVDPANVQALTYRGWLMRLAGLNDEGLQSIDRAIATQPNYPDAHFFRGYILLNDKLDPQGAINEFDIFLANNPPQAMVPLVQQARKDAEARLAVAK